MMEYLSSCWHEKLQFNQLDSFEKLWQLETDWFEEPNIRRGGWSGVVKYTLQFQDGPEEAFIKRQENHITKTLLHCYKGIPTFQKEYNNIKRLTSKNIPTLELVYFGRQGFKAILVTKALEGYIPLEDFDVKTLDREQRVSLLDQIAATARQMHHYHFQHNCFYPKHIFVKSVGDSWKVRIIDLEKLKRTLFKSQAVKRDLFTLQRHANDDWGIRDSLYFLRSYMREHKLSARSKKLWHQLAKRLRRKHK